MKGLLCRDGSFHFAVFAKRVPVDRDVQWVGENKCDPSSTSIKQTSAISKEIARVDREPQRKTE
jgi:hypothetical protein